LNAIANVPDDCLPIRLDGSGGSMEHFPVKNQGSLNLCSAMSAASLIDAWRYSHDAKITRQNQISYTSAIELALGNKFRNEHRSLPMNIKEKWLTYLYRNSEKPYDFNLFDALIEYARRNGTCAAEDYESDPLDYSKVQYQLNTLTEFFKNYREWKQFSELPIYDDQDADLLEQNRSWFYSVSENTHCRVNELFPYPTLIPNLDEIVTESNDLLDFLYKIYSEGCKSRRFQKFPALKTETPSSEEELRKIVFRQFDNSEEPLQPIAFDYCGSLLFSGPDYLGIKPISSSLRTPINGCAPHTSLIIGRRFNVQKNKCEVLLRNTWGGSIERYHSDFEMDAKYEKISRVTEKNGHYHVIHDSDQKQDLIEKFRKEGATISDDTLIKHEKRVRVTLKEKDGSLHIINEPDNNVELIESYQRQGAIINEESFHSNGNVWIPFEALTKNIFYVHSWELQHKQLK
jgi:hypothetical protein